MGRTSESTTREAEWRLRLFGVACDAEEAERWQEAFCIYQHLFCMAAPDVELRLRLARVALHVREFRVAEDQSLEIDRLLHEDTDLRALFKHEAANLRYKLQKLAWDQYASDPSDFD